MMMGRRKDDIAEPEDRHSDWFLKDSDLECLRNETKPLPSRLYCVRSFLSESERDFFMEFKDGRLIIRI